MDVRNRDEVISRMKAAVANKQFGQADILCRLSVEVYIQVCPKNPANFNVDNVRITKLLGGGLHDTTIVQGMVLKTDAVGGIKRMEKAKVAVFDGGMDTSSTETKGTVLIRGAEQLENYSRTEEAKIEELIIAVAESGAKVIVSSVAVGEMALHFCERYKLVDPVFFVLLDACRGHDFSKANFGSHTVILCDLCEWENHDGYLKVQGLDDLKELPSEKWFCGREGISEREDNGLWAALTEHAKPRICCFMLVKDQDGKRTTALCISACAYTVEVPKAWPTIFTAFQGGTGSCGTIAIATSSSRGST